MRPTAGPGCQTQPTGNSLTSTLRTAPTRCPLSDIEWNCAAASMSALDYRNYPGGPMNNLSCTGNELFMSSA